MAEGYLRYFCNDKSEVYSAGFEAHGLNPKAVQVMLEDGIDISHHTSNQIDDYKHTGFDYVITVCDNAKENCPYFPSTAKKYHYNFPDPVKASGTEEEILQQFRAVRDTIKDYCKKFAVDHLA